MTEQRLRAVLDTNVVLAALKSKNPHSPTAELVQRWEAGEFDTYDPHIHTLGSTYQGIRILDGLHFLYALRGDRPPLSDLTKR